MSNRKKQTPPTPTPGFQPSMSVIPSIYANQYEFAIEGGLIGLRFGRNGQTHADVTIPVNMMMDLLNKVQERVINQVRQQSAAPVASDLTTPTLPDQLLANPVEETKP